MQPFQWSRAYTVSVPEVDAEHRLLFQLGSDLRRSVLGRKTEKAVQAALGELAAHVAEHFLHEEREMHSAAYPLYEWHKRQHAAGRAKFRVLQRRIPHGDRAESSELLDALGGWLANHIRLADRMWAAYARNHKRAESAQLVKSARLS